MTPLRTSEEISAAFLAACRLELQALKPGNVHIHAGGHGMEAEQFELAAAASAPHIAAQGLPVGTRIRRAVEASFAAAGCNTNLGILLLCVPLAYAVGEPVPGDDLKSRLAHVLAQLDRDDAAETFAAIAHANPGGLGRSDEADVSGPAQVTLREAMAIAADRDRIARAYVSDFADIFSFGLPLYRSAIGAAATPELAVTTLHMAYLAEFPDTHIARKYGEATALEIRDAARALSPNWQPVARQESLRALIEFDSRLKVSAINPGTTADFVVATIFASRL